MFRYVKNKDIDYKLWDECIDNSENGIIYALSWYLDITAPGWDGIIKEEGGKYEVVMPIPVFRKFGIRYVKQPLYTHQLGIFYQSETPVQEGVEMLSQIFKKKFKYIQSYEFNTDNTSILKDKFNYFKKANYFTYHILLDKSINEIYSGYSINRKRSLKKASEATLTFKKNQDVGALINMFQENVAGKIYGLADRRDVYINLRSIFSAASERNMCSIWTAEDRNHNIIARAMFLEYKDKIIYLFSAANEAGKKAGAISALIHHIIEISLSKATTFDFESPQVSHVTEFYRRFGAKAVTFVSISRNELPSGIKLIKQLRLKLYRKFINSENLHLKGQNQGVFL